MKKPFLQRQLMILDWSENGGEEFCHKSIATIAAQSEVCRALWRNCLLMGEYLLKMRLSDLVKGIYGFP